LSADGSYTIGSTDDLALKVSVFVEEEYAYQIKVTVSDGDLY